MVVFGIMIIIAVYVWYFYICFFFFFQAEDGIRDIGVTGVQTCALPISDLYPLTCLAWVILPASIALRVRDTQAPQSNGKVDRKSVV